MEKNLEKKQVHAERVPDFGLGRRHLLVILMFLCLVILYGIRVNISVAIVAMTDTNSTLGFPTYNWTRKEQGLILSSFYWGYVFIQIPAAFIGQRWGPHYPLGMAGILTSIALMITPFLAQFGPVAVVGDRIIHGLAQGFCYPSLHNLCSKWIPRNERGRLITFIYAGAGLGIVISLSVSGLLASNEYFGWPSLFYCGGCAGITWAILWILFGGNRPSEYKSMSHDEVKYIEASMGYNVLSSKKELSIPWLAILTSKHMWALIIVNITNNWSSLTLLNEMPTYMKDVLKYDIKRSGWSSALPYLAQWLLSFVFGFLSDFMINRNLLSVTVSRKLYSTIATWIPSGALVILGFTQAPSLALTLLIIAIGINAGGHVSFSINHIDLAPNFAGILMGITNCLANIASIISPVCVGYIVDDEHPTVGQWRTVFLIAAAINFFGNLVFILFGTAKLQKWNGPVIKSDTVSTTSTFTLRRFK